MKSRDAALRLKQFEADAKSRLIRDLQQMIQEFEQMAADLDRQIAIEEERTGHKDRNHFAYSTFARAAAQRRDNLHASAAELRDKLSTAMQERDQALEQVVKSGVAERRASQQRGKRRGERVLQAGAR